MFLCIYIFMFITSILFDHFACRITLISGDKEKFQISRQVAMMSELLKTVAECTCYADEASSAPPDTNIHFLSFVFWHFFMFRARLFAVLHLLNTHSLISSPPCLLPFHPSLPAESNPDKGIEIPLNNVKQSVLSRVVRYMNYHSQNPAKEIEKVHTPP